MQTYKKFGLRLTDPWTNTTLHNVNAAATGPAMFEMQVGATWAGDATEGDGNPLHRMSSQAPMPTLEEVLTAPQTQRCTAAGGHYRTDALKRVLQRRKGKQRLPEDWSPVDDGFANEGRDDAE